MLQTKSEGQWPLVSRIFLGILPYMGMVAIVK